MTLEEFEYWYNFLYEIPANNGINAGNHIVLCNYELYNNIGVILADHDGDNMIYPDKGIPYKKRVESAYNYIKEHGSLEQCKKNFLKLKLELA